MQEIKIKRGLEFVNGGCNACPTFKEDIYVMQLNDKEHVLEELNLNSLIMAIVVDDGFKLHQEYGMSEDYDVYKKAGQEVAVILEYDKLIIKKGSLQLKVKNHYQEESELFAVASNILTQYFDIESINFIVEKEL